MVKGIASFIIDFDNTEIKYIFSNPVLQYMRGKRFDFSRPAGIVCMNLLLLSIVACAFSIVFFILDKVFAGSGSYWALADWGNAALFTFIEACIGLFITLVFLYLNYKETKKANKVPNWVIQRRKEKAKYSPIPTCKNCRRTLRYNVDSSRWYCDNCDIYPNTF